jgi:hypothetical protein
MKIKSKFKDYYDYVAHAYGWSDEKITYVRDRFPYVEDIKSFFINFGGAILNPPNKFSRDTMGHDFKWVIVAGRYYLIISPEYKDEWVLYSSKHPLANRLVGNSRMYIGQEDNNLIELSRILKAPVFCVKGTNYNWRAKRIDIEVGYDIPNLGELGFASIIPPEQMYQDIYYFMGNVIHISPDMMPEPNPAMTDKERIISHGFDLKASFRHRV